MSCKTGNKSDTGVFNDCKIVLIKANISKTRYALLEEKIHANAGQLLNDMNLYNVTHVVIEDTLCNDASNCMNVLQKNGFKVNKSYDFELVRLEWICESLKQKQKVHIDNYKINLLPTLSDTNCSDHISEKPEDVEEDFQPPETKKAKQVSVDNSQYVCSRASVNDSNLEKNHVIISELSKLADAFRVQGDKWRSYSYEKAVRSIKNYNKEITSYEEARQLPGIGESVAKKVKEVLEVGNIRKVIEVCDEKSKVFDLFYGVWGAGPATAKAWYRQGFRTLDDLRTKAKLTNQQKVGLKYYHEFQERIPRCEIEEISEIIKKKALAIDNSLKFVICGSYRRGKETCGDIDIMIIKPDNATVDTLYLLHEELKKIGIITDDLTTFETKGEDKKYLGVCKLPGENHLHRRFDLFFYPESESACAIMHCTGSALFNRSIRLLASRKGMMLSEHALSTGVIRDGNKVKNAGVILPTPTEESIFKHLGLEYRPPEARDH